MVYLWDPGFGQFSGPDPHMRLARVLECAGGFACPDGRFMRSNVPYGEILHWPFLMDWLLLALAAPLVPFVGFRTAVLSAGYALGPLLGIGALWAATAAARPMLGAAARAAVAPLLALHFWVLVAFAPVRPDHHGLQILLFIGVLAGVLRLAVQPDARAAVGTGLAAGLAVWVSTEGLLSTAPLLLMPALAWLVRGGERWGRLNAWLFTASALTLALGLVVDGPRPVRWAVEFDRFSVVHLMAFTLVAAFWWGVHRLRGRLQTWPRRLAAAALGLWAVLLALVLAFPGIQRGPMADVHPALAPLWLSQVSEFMPLWADTSGIWTWAALAPGAAALLVCLAALRLEATPRRWAFLPLLVALAWFGTLALAGQVRWTHYVHALAPLPLAWLMVTAARRLAPAVSPLGRAAWHTACVLGVLAWPVVTLAVPAVAGDRGPGTAAAGACSPRRAALALGSLPSPVPGRRPRVLAQVFWGPELLLLADVDVVQGPYHRNHQGMLYAHAVMSATNPAEARRLLGEREIDYVAVCGTEDFIPLVDRATPGTLYHRLVGGDPPAWLTPWPVPGLPPQYRVYAFVR